MQLPLFAEAASLARIRPERNEWRFYRMEVWPDLFGRALLLRQWGRIGTEGRRRLDPHPDPGAALNALARLAGAKTAPRLPGPRRMTRSPAARKTPGETSGPAPPSAMGLYTADGARKYLTAGEREAFLRAAERADREARTLCMTLAYGGCRLSEALARTSGRSDMAKAIRYSLKRWDALTLVLRDGRACIDNSAAERAMRPMPSAGATGPSPVRMQVGCVQRRSTA